MENGIVELDTQAPDAFQNDPFPIHNHTFIAPFYGNVDTRGAGTVKCGNGRNVTIDTDALAMAEEHIRKAFPEHEDFCPVYLIVATWDGVGYYDQKSDMVSKHYNIYSTV